MATTLESGGGAPSPVILWAVSTLGYAISAAAWIVSLRLGGVFPAVARGAAIVAFGVQGVSLALEVPGEGSPGLADFGDRLSFLLWGLVGAALAIDALVQTRSLGAFVLPLVVVAQVGLGPAGARPARAPGWATLAGTAHGVAALLGCAFVAVAFVSAALFLVQDRTLKLRRLGPLGGWLPPVHALARANAVSLAVGFPLLTIGIGIGAGSATAHGPEGVAWSRDVTVLAGLALWVLVATLLVLRRERGLGGRQVAIGTVAAFAVVLFAILGARFAPHASARLARTFPEGATAPLHR